MAGSQRSFPIVIVVVLVAGAAAVVGGVLYTTRLMAEDSGRMGAATEAVRSLMSLHLAMGRYRIDALTDVDADGTGEYGSLRQVAEAGLLEGEGFSSVEEGLRRNGYRFMAVLPTATDDAEERFAVVALPTREGWPVMAVDQVGDIRLAPEGFRPGGGVPVDPTTWPKWSR